MVDDPPAINASRGQIHAITWFRRRDAGGMRPRRNLNNSDSEGASGDERSVELEPSASPEAMSKPLARVGPDRELPPLDVIQQQSAFTKHEDIPSMKQFPQHKSEQVLTVSSERRAARSWILIALDSCHRWCYHLRRV